MTDAERSHNASPLSPRASLRASRAPMGPRTRLPSTSLAPTAAESSNRDSLRSGGSIRSRDSCRTSYSGSSSPGRVSPICDSESPPRTEVKPLPKIEAPRVNAPPPPPPTTTPFPAIISPSPSPTPSRVASMQAPTMNTIVEDVDAGTTSIAQPYEDSPPPFSSLPHSAPPSRAASVSSSPAPAFKPVARAATLPPPPKITFDTAPISLKGLPLEAALCTFLRIAS